MNKKDLQNIPAVHEVLHEVNKAYHLHEKYIQIIITKEINQLRESILKGNISGSRDEYFDRILSNVIEQMKPSIKNVINGTGVVLHTGLGRSPFHGKQLKQIADTLDGYVNLELELASGKRGERQTHVNPLMTAITGSEASLVVNNNAAAVLLSLNAMAHEKEVIISRGQLVEIGGSFRIPDIIEKSGCILKEVGSTNRTHLKDYESAITPETGILLWVHTSNYIVDGFTKDVSLKELVKLGKIHGIPVLADLGSGALIHMDEMGLPIELPVKEIVSMGPTITTFSGDKLLGGPQSGIIAGEKKWIDQIHDNPIYRAVRSDKLTITLLEDSLRQYGKTSVSKSNLALSLLATKRSVLKKRGEKVLNQLPSKQISFLGITLEESTVEAGSGSLPVQSIESMALVFRPKSFKANELSKIFRQADHPILGYINQEKYFIDLKAILPSQIDALIQSITQVK